MSDLKPTPKELIEMLTFYYTWIINNMMIPGHIENWLIIVDLKNLNIMDISLSLLGALLDTLEIVFKNRCYRLILINTDWLKNTILNIIF